MEITLRPTIKQHQVFQALQNPLVDTVFFGGGAGGGKSWVICESRLVNAIRYPGYKSYIGREELKRLMQSTYVTWTKVCSFHNVPQDEWKLNGQYNYIEFKNGSRIDLLDLKYLPTDPMYERFGSLEYTDGAIEEAGEVDFLAYDVIKSRHGRHMNQEYGLNTATLITANPKKNWLYTTFYKPWKKNQLPDNVRFIQALYGDNEHTADIYGKQLSLISDQATRARLKDGNWEYDDDPATLIDYDAISDLWTNAIPFSEDKYLTADIARYGADKCVVLCWKGYEVYKQYRWEKRGLDQTITTVRDILRNEQIPYSHAIADDDGVGGGVVDLLKIKGFINGSSPLENRKTQKKDNYQNLKTQCYYLLSEKINTRSLSVKCFNEKEKEELTEELEQVKQKNADQDGKLMIIPKDEVKEILGRSPDSSDALMMRMYFELSPSNILTKRQHIPSGLVRNIRPDLPNTGNIE